MVIHVVGGEADKALVVFVGRYTPFDGTSKGWEEMAKEHFSFPRGGGEGHVLGHRGGEGDDVAPTRGGAAIHHGDTPGAGAAAVNNAVGEGVLPNDEIGGDGAGDVTENTRRLLLRATGRRAHVAAQEADRRGDVGPGHVRTIKESADR